MFTSTNLLVPALIFVAVGLLAGILIMTLVGDRRRRKDEADRSSPVMDDLIVPEMPVLPETRFVSIANLYRESRSGKLVTDVKGKVYLNRGSIPEELLRDLQEAARNWQIWLGVPAAEPPAAAPVAVPAFEQAPSVTAEPEVAPEMPKFEDVTLAAESDLAELEAESVEPNPAEMEPVANEPVATEPAATAILPPIPPAPVVRIAPIEKPRSRTMVGQIDDVLQEMLPETVFAGQNIHLGEEYTNGVVVWVGANKYIGIDAVPDAEIKALIQSAVRKWEASEGNI